MSGTVMLAFTIAILAVLGGRRYGKSHPELVQRYETIAQKHFRLRNIIGARIATYVVVPGPYRPPVFAAIAIVTYVTVWRWIQRKRTNRAQHLRGKP